MSAADPLSRIVANLHLTDVAQSAIDGTLDPRAWGDTTGSTPS